MSAPL